MDGPRLMSERGTLGSLRGEITHGRESGPGIPAGETFRRIRTRIEEIGRERAGLNARPKAK